MNVVSRSVFLLCPLGPCDSKTEGRGREDFSIARARVHSRSIGRVMGFIRLKVTDAKRRLMAICQFAPRA